jgi:hypothetical protein
MSHLLTLVCSLNAAQVDAEDLSLHHPPSLLTRHRVHSSPSIRALDSEVRISHLSSMVLGQKTQCTVSRDHGPLLLVAALC